MTDEQHEDISRALGRVEGTIQSLMVQWRQQEAEATRLRHENSQRLLILERQVDRVANDVQNVQQDVAELKNEAEPMMDEYKAEVNKKLGRRGLWISIGAALSAGGAVAYKMATDFYHGFIAPPPH